MFPSFTQEHCMCRPKKNPQTQNLKLEFNDTSKTNNSSSQEANDLLYRLEQTVDLHSVQLSPNLEMHQTTSLDMLLSRQPNIAKTAAPTV